jgi:phenylalanine-4-hydroxylase
MRQHERVDGDPLTARAAYSPVVTSEDGSVEVQLSADHPGVSDPEYRRRRNEIARLSLDHAVGDPVPVVDYTDEEHEVWRIVSAELAPSHDRRACRSFLEAKTALALPGDHVPQLSEVTERLAPLSGFVYEPVPGLAPLREFYGSFARRTFFSTQYVRHPSVPRYTPEPDIIHEVIGHANQLADPDFARLYLAVGDAVARTSDPRALEFLSRVFWFTLEFGVVFEHGEPKAYGAGILSSLGELDRFQSATIRPLDLRAMGAGNYDITHYQPVIFSLGSIEELHDRLGEFFGSFDDDAHARLAAPGAP